MISSNNRSSSAADANYSSAKNQANQAGQKAADAGNQAIDGVRQFASDTRDSVVEYAERAGRDVRSKFSDVYGNVSDAADQVTGQIKSHPLQATAIALGVGVLLGAIVSRR